MASDLRPGHQFAGYRIENLIARGGMGIVYRATQHSLGRTVALKLIAPELAPELASQEAFRERFLREARMSASLEHGHERDATRRCRRYPFEYEAPRPAGLRAPRL